MLHVLQSPTIRFLIEYLTNGLGKRKVSCRGGRPCLRCQQDGRECSNVSNERTPLTRKRMTELEEKLSVFNLLWDSLYPQLPLDTVYVRVAAVGFGQAVNEIKGTRRSPNVQQPETEFSRTTHLPADPLPTVLQSGTEVESPISPSNVPPCRSVTPAAYPPTRPTSPPALSLKIAYDLEADTQTPSNEWNEEKSPWNGLPQPPLADQLAADATPRDDCGTGVRGGVGYFGLSSGMALLRAVQRFSPGTSVPLTYPPGSKHDPASFLGSTVGRQSCEARELPPASEIEPLIDGYFRYFHALTPILHEPTIRAQLTGALPLPNSSGSHVLFNMVFAMGALDSAADDSPSDVGFKYYEAARSALQYDLLEGGSLFLVQGLAIMAIYLQRINKPNSSYLCLGLAIRMAMALGIHVSPQNSSGKGVTVLESEMRCRIWWGLVTLEAGMCMTYGRPHAISLASLSAVRLPVNTEDEYLTVSTTKQPSDTTQTTRYTALITQANLAQMALQSQDRISRSLPSPTVDQIKWCGDRFLDQLAALPVYSQAPPPRYRLATAIQVWRARDYTSVLYRPVFLSAAWSSGGRATSDETVREIVHTCRYLALQNLQEIADFMATTHDPHKGCEWYTLYYGIQASLTILLSIVWEPNHPDAASWRKHITQTTAWLRCLQSMNQMGVSWAQTMENVLSGRPTGQTEHSTEDLESLMRLGGDIPPDIATFDFERYFSEIWGDQTQIAGVTSDVGPVGESDNWEGMVMGFLGDI